MGLHLNEGGDDLAENHEINVTPFIDVMLVLLIIFMVAAPLATVDIKVDLPASTAKPAPRPEKPVFVSVKADKKLYVGDDAVPLPEQLGAMLDAKTKGDKETTIFFQADKGVDYGDLMEVMNTMRAAGYLKVGLVGLETAAKK
ncbi:MULTISPECIES: TonB system transport protein ExbD [unclassified Pseudomonas]|uniref:TonB system transport protein ExbD n=1 Tax=Pseudomonas TaxID=286 RepID=UPI001648299E|nr:MULTISPECIES: TonB system transport protein ExbD [unclassified Pseudomonas]MBC3423803.1 TonB system transport protein ExbD [Pseudomonas sp. RW3S2]MBC3467028.1 TonB system transport protein ExbD [Pseudomonas sp. RW10S2]QXI43464.1 TonB system transport protein ExbD [Pseudomonas wayambapalatensis]